jgi:hypothetical protein
MKDVISYKQFCPYLRSTLEISYSNTEVQLSNFRRAWCKPKFNLFHRPLKGRGRQYTGNKQRAETARSFRSFEGK